MSILDSTQVPVITTHADTFARLYASSTGLIRRFFGDARPTLKASLTKLNEECDELKQALWELESGETTQTDHLAGEAADVLVTLLNTLYAVGVEYSQLEAALNRTIEKNDAKTHDTHEVVNGLIARKKRGVE